MAEIPNSIEKAFEPLSSQEILSQPPGRWDDYDLLEVAAHFDDQGDKERKNALFELILRSPHLDEMVDYPQLYEELVAFTREQDFQAALRWAYAWLAYNEQHGPDEFRSYYQALLAELYLEAGELDPALGLLTRMVLSDPEDLSSYATAGGLLIEYGFTALGVETVERGRDKIGPGDPEDWGKAYEDLLKEAQGEPDDGTRMEAVSARRAAEFREALAHPGRPAGRDEDGPQPYLSPIQDLIAADEETAKTLSDEILSQGPVLAPELVRLAFDPEQMDGLGPGRAVTILRELQGLRPELAELSAWLERAEGNWQAELLTDSMGKIGGFSTGELEAFAAGLDFAEHLRVGSLRALVERVEKVPSERARVIEFFRSLLTRPEAQRASEEGFTGLLILNILDLDGRELLPEIRQAFEEDRVEPFIVSLADVLEDWDLPAPPRPPVREDGMNLLLKCQSCGRAREHFVQYALVDIETLEQMESGETPSREAIIFDREIVCPKCSGRDRYELTAQANLALLGPQDEGTLAEILAGKETEKHIRPNPRMLYLPPGTFPPEQHPLDLLDDLRREQVKRLGDAELHLALGEFLRLLLRSEEALETLRFAADLAPTNPQILLTLAETEHDYGDLEAARRAYEKLLELESDEQRVARGLPGYSEHRQVARTGLDLLKRGKPSRWEPEVFNRDGRRISFPKPRRPAGGQAQKSGKKKRRR